MNESIKREPKIRGIYECRCDERLQTKKTPIEDFFWGISKMEKKKKLRWSERG
jgi:hypothetical protein